MKKLEQLLVRGRAAARAARTALPVGQAGLRPVRLVLRLNDIQLAPGLVRARGEPLTLSQWREAIVRVVRWLGPIRITVAGGEPAHSAHLEELLRFANRLECPTHLVTGGGVTAEQAIALVDRGLGAVTVLVGGVDEGTHKAVVGTTLAQVSQTLEGFRGARGQRDRPLGIYVGFPLGQSNLRSAAAVGGWARQAGADGVLATAPLGEQIPEGALEAISELGRDNLTPEHLVRWLGGDQTRPHGGLRAELLSDGTLLVSSHVAPLGNVRDAAPDDLWQAGHEQLREALRHPRPWDEVELVPRVLYSHR